MPVIGASRKAGTNSANPSSPKYSGRPVMSNTCLPRIVICPTVIAIEKKVAPKRAQSLGPIRAEPGGGSGGTDPLTAGRAPMAGPAPPQVTAAARSEAPAPR